MFLDSELHEPQTEEEEEEQREEEVHSEARMHQRCCNAPPVGGGGGGEGGQEPRAKPGCINDAAMHPPVGGAGEEGEDDEDEVQSKPRMHPRCCNSPSRQRSLLTCPCKHS